MAYVKYPWHRFQQWLNRQPPQAIAGVHASDRQNVISRYLEKRIGGTVQNWRISYAYIFPENCQKIAYAELPEWAGRLLAILDEVKEDGCYQYRTVKKALAKVKCEYKKAS